jgi:4-hydroxy-3-polyprenylbenzoate decarboxylase
LINAFGSHQRMSLALGVEELDELNLRLASIIDPRLPDGFRQMISRGQGLLDVLRSIGMGPKKVRRGPVQEIVETEKPSLDFMPILHCWPEDAATLVCTDFKS